MRCWFSAKPLVNSRNVSEYHDHGFEVSEITGEFVLEESELRDYWGFLLSLDQLNRKKKKKETKH